MSRIRRLSHSLSSGYVQIFANTAFTLLSVPLALYYLSKSEFGLWALVTQVVGYISMVELGMTAAMGRVLIDHKDRPAEGMYGSVIKTGCIVLVVQGAIVALLSWGLGSVLPKLMAIPPDLFASFYWLVGGYGLVVGVLFPQRMLYCVFFAHQRNDILNYSAASSFAVSLAAMWVGLHSGMGVHSLLIAHVLGLLLQAGIQVEAARRLRLLPPRGSWGRFDRKIFREIFSFGSDLFLLTIGLQLLNGSQVIIITRILGLEAAALWSVATKLFTLAQQFVWRLWDFSVGAISEMVVREERERLRHRFQDIFVLTASAATLSSILVAVCNESLLSLWTNGRIAWSGSNDLLMAALFVVTSVTRLNIGLIAATKKIRTMRYVYFAEGVCFALFSLFLVRWWGIGGMICTAILMDVLWTGIYGTKRTAEEFQTNFKEIAWIWTKPALRLAGLLVPIAIACWWLIRPLSGIVRLGIGSLIVGGIGLFLMWNVGLTPSLQYEFRRMFDKIGKNLKCISSGKKYADDSST